MSRLGYGPAAVVNGLLVAVAPVVIAAGLVRELRDERRVIVGTLAGVVSIYLVTVVALIVGNLGRVRAGPG